MSLTKVSYSMLTGAAINVLDYGATGKGIVNDANAIQAAIDACVTGGTVYFPVGNYLCLSGLTVTNNNLSLEFANGATLTYTTATQILLTINGTNCKLIGATINAPAIFDGTNAFINYSVVKIQGDSFTANSCVINNVPRAGFWFYECNNGIVTNCRIDGGTTQSFYIAGALVHFGIAIDTPATGSQGNYIISNNIIKRCVQGAGSGSTGTVSAEQSMSVTGNVFELCWNHGWYTSGLANGISVSGNAFNACQIPIALTGKNHAVIGNTLTVQSTGSGLPTDNEWQGISLRDPYGCVVMGNTIKGEAPAGGVVIGLDDLAGVVSTYNSCENNIVSGNTIEITNVTTGSVSAIRILANLTKAVNNTICDNVIKAPVREFDGLIEIFGSVGSNSEGNSITNNTLIFTGCGGSAYGIYTSCIKDSTISNNRIRIDFNAISPVNITCVGFNSCERLRIFQNQLRCSASYGTNISARAFEEQTSGYNNSLIDNTVYFDATKLSSSILFLILKTSDILVEHTGVGSPESAIISCVGGLWKRTDGGVNTTLYVKEVGSDNFGWAAV